MYPVGVVHDVTNDQYYPIIYKPAPEPGEQMDYTAAGSNRYKSYGHYTEGFKTIELALECIKLNTWIDAGIRFDCNASIFPDDTRFIPNSVFYKEEV